MTTISGTYRDGRVDLASPVDWPDGLRVEITVPVEEHIGLDEADWPTTDEGRAELVARFEAIGPLVFTAEDEAEIESARQAVREITLEAVRRKMGLP